MSGIKCTICGWFCKNVQATLDWDDNIKRVEGICKRCGKVDLTDGDWSYENFFPDNKSEQKLKE